MPDDEEKLQLRADVERFKKTIRQKDEMIEEMENELNNRGKSPVSNGKAEAKEKELSSQIRDLQFEMDGKDATIHEQTDLINTLRDEIDKLEKTNRELINRSYCAESDESSSFVETELLRISEECEKFKEVASSLFEQNVELKKEAVELREEHDAAVDHVRSLESHIKTKEEEITRLEGEVFDLRNSSQGKHASSGNSIFAEAMEAERKLEEDLKLLFREKQSLMTMVKRLTLEKEDAEDRARNCIDRGRVVRQAMSHIDVEEMRRLRTRVHQLESERTHLWERLFIKMKSIPKRELGSLIASYFDSFKCSIASMKGGFEELLKKNEQYVTTIRGLQQELENQRGKVEQLEFDVECAERKLRSAANVELENPQLRAPLKPMNTARPSFFVKPKKIDSTTSLETSMSSMLMTPQKPYNPIAASSTAKTEASDWAERRQKAKAEKKSATPAQHFNYVKLAAPVPKFKAAVLQMPSSPTDSNPQ
uniref:Kinesin motor domain-containing protein n=2 Tax=Caenorhabditis tropicalis TaxID=1561998 RepID=A0A1I7T4S4_9PELO